MSFDVDLIVWSKLVSLAIFAPIYVGALVYACWKPNRQRFERLAELPLLED
ncbi:MAG: hypothetical protein JWM80_4740 [Cyanobacteria bacterium RYN_339]|nr:hypothetical protein [Cyanobacteria bacterium RYN_339]